jgi:hypothetical protein
MLRTDKGRQQCFTIANNVSVLVCRPGAYQTTPKWASSNAAAQSHREAASKKVSELLGPAAAASSSVALAAVQSAVKSASSGSKPAEVPVLTPPSIPARHQSYG